MSQATLFDLGLEGQSESGEDPAFLTKELVTYIGNKRGLAGPIAQAVVDVCNRLGGRKLRLMDLFAGSGFVASLMKKHSSLVASNNLELYAQVIGECFLVDRDEALLAEATRHANRLNRAVLDAERHTPASSASCTLQSTTRTSKRVNGSSTRMTRHAVLTSMSRS